MFRISVIAGHASGIQVQSFIQRQLQDNCLLRRQVSDLEFLLRRKEDACEELESLLCRKEEDLSFMSRHVFRTMADNTSLTSAHELLFRDNRHDVGVQCSETAMQGAQRMHLQRVARTNTETRSRAAQTYTEQRKFFKNKDTQTKTATNNAGVQCSLGYEDKDTQTNTATATARVQCCLGFESLQMQPGRVHRDWEYLNREFVDSDSGSQPGTEIAGQHPSQESHVQS